MYPWSWEGGDWCPKRKEEEERGLRKKEEEEAKLGTREGKGERRMPFSLSVGGTTVGVRFTNTDGKKCYAIAERKKKNRIKLRVKVHFSMKIGEFSLRTYGRRKGGGRDGEGNPINSPKPFILPLSFPFPPCLEASEEREEGRKRMVLGKILNFHRE